MYDPAEYWEKRLARRFSLRGVGHQSYGLCYNYWLYKRKRRVLEKIFSATNLQKKIVLDVGAGTGFFLEWYRAQGAKLHGVDISPTAIRELGKKFPEARLFELDFTRPNILLSQTYDIVNAWDVVYHQPNDQNFLELLKNTAAACKTGGLFLCSDGFGFPQPLALAEHVKFRNRETYRPVMQQLGFKLLKEYPLYRGLNRSPEPDRFNRYLYQLMAPIHYWFDQFQSTPAEDNLSVSVWIKNRTSELL